MEDFHSPSGKQYLLYDTDFYNSVFDLVTQPGFIKPILKDIIKVNLESKLRSINIEIKDSDFIIPDEKLSFLPLELKAKTPFQLYYILKYKELKELIVTGIRYITIEASYLAELSENPAEIRSYAEKLIQAYVYKIIISEIVLFNAAEMNIDTIKNLIFSKDETIKELEKKLPRHTLSERDRKQHFMIIDYIIENKSAGITYAIRNVKRLPRYKDSDLGKLFHKFRINHKDDIISYLSKKVLPEKIPHIMKLLYTNMEKK